MIVADTNLVAYLVIEGDRSGAARTAYRRDPDWRLPPLWRAEILNALVTTVRAGVLDNAGGLEAWGLAVALFGQSEQEPSAELVYETAFKYGISAYDAQFVALAELMGVTLVTGDREVARKCKPIAVYLEKFAAGA